MLHDCHAEILAIRAFNYWVLSECDSIIRHEQQADNSQKDGKSSSTNDGSPFVRRRPRQTSSESGHESRDFWPPFEICPDVKIYMYCTCAPCGDASMELCMAAQEDPTPWAVTPKPELQTDEGMTSNIPSVQNLLDGRAHFSILGVVRRKPARADAESTLSKSCSDKLALRQVTSLLSYPASLLVAPTENAYLAGLILPEEEISCVACDRAFGAGPTGRMRELACRWWRNDGCRSDEKYGYRFRPFEVLSVPTETVEALWPYGKKKAEVIPTSSKGRKKNSGKPSNISAVWVIAPSSSSQVPFQMRSGSENEAKKHKVRAATTTGLVETIINGVKQGNQAASITARGSSVLSRAKMWNLLRDIVTKILSPPSDNDNDHDNAAVVSDDRGDASTSLKTNERDSYSRPWRTILEAPSYEQFKRPSEGFLEEEDGCSSIPIQLPPHLRLRKLAMQDAKRVLKPWIPNRGDEDWNVTEVIVADRRNKNVDRKVLKMES